MSTQLTPGDEPTMKDAFDLIAKQGADLAELSQALRLLANGALSAGATARGAGDRIKVADLVAKATRR